MFILWEKSTIPVGINHLFGLTFPKSGVLKKQTRIDEQKPDGWYPICTPKTALYLWWLNNIQLIANPLVADGLPLLKKHLFNNKESCLSIIVDGQQPITPSVPRVSLLMVVSSQEL